MAVTNDLMTDRRVKRHAATLREAGYDVLLIGRNDLKLKHRRHWQFYAEYNWRLLWRLLREGMDIVWANDTDTLPACWMAARLRRKKLVMDSHEIFPEVPELVDRHRVKRVWERIEDFLLPRCDANLTVCHSVADYYLRRYGVEMAVVRNISAKPRTEYPVADEGLLPASPLATLLYQGAVNKGRGVDWAIDALEMLTDCRLVVAGVGDLYDETRAYAEGKPWCDRIVFLGRLAPERLEALTPMARVGLVMLEDMGLNYHFSLPNRIGDFVAAGVPMVVSDLPEMAAVVRRFGVGEVIDKEKDKVQGLVEAVRRVMDRKWEDSDFDEARRDMDWQREKEKLLAVADKVSIKRKTEKER